MVDSKAIERAVMDDRNRPCLFGVRGPCFHPKCLDNHYQTLKQDKLKACGGKDEM